MMAAPLIEKQIHKLMKDWSNDKLDQSKIKEEWIQEFLTHCEDSIRKQLKPRDNEYYHRASAMGRPLCILQNQKKKSPKSEKEYNFIMKMLIGDMTEGVVSLMAKMAGVDIVAEGTETELVLGGAKIVGTDDHTIKTPTGKKVYDTKTTSSFQWRDKWSKGYDALKDNDTFGYISQLHIYAMGQGIDVGGWIVVNKETGELKVVEAPEDKEEKDRVIHELQTKIKALDGNWSFMKCFEPLDEKFNKKSTDSKYLGTECSFCDFREVCWPHAQRLPKAKSTAKNVTYRWYTRYLGKDLDEDTKRKGQGPKAATMGAKQTPRKVS